MSTLTKYVVAEGVRGGVTEETESYEFDSYADAKTYAQLYNLAVIEYEYEFSDSSLVDDFRPEAEDDGEDVL